MARGADHPTVLVVHPQPHVLRRVAGELDAHAAVTVADPTDGVPHGHWDVVFADEAIARARLLSRRADAVVFLGDMSAPLASPPRVDIDEPSGLSWALGAALAAAELGRAEARAAELLPPRLASAISHSLANSLTVLRGSLELGHTDADDLLPHVDRAAAVGTALRSGWGLGDDPPVPVDLRDLAQMAATTLASELSDRATLSLEAGPELPAVVAPQGRVLRSVLGLLLALGDALHGRPEPVKVELRTHGDLTTVVIDAVAHDAPLSVRELKASPWLIAADRLVRDIRGRIGVRAVGDELRLSLRLAIDTGLKPATSVPTTGAPRALVVDDQGFVLKVLSTLLQALGWQAVTAMSVTEALVILEQDPGFSIVLSDLEMPGLGGDALLEALKHRHPELAERFVIVTGGATSPARAEFLSSLDTPILRKPVGLTDLRQILGMEK